MLNLTSTSDKIQVITGAAVTVDVHASYIDYDGTAVTIPLSALAAITTATTTDVVGSPASGVKRNVKLLNIRNKHASSPVDVTVQHTDGTTTVQLYKTTLTAGEVVWFIEGVGWSLQRESAGVYEYYVLAGDVSTGANTTPVDVTGLVFSFVVNAVYMIDLIALMQSPANTTGYGLQFNVDVAVTDVAFTFFHQLANTGTLSGGSSVADDTSVGVSSGVPTNATNVPLAGHGLLVAGANAGTAQLRLRSETTAVATIKAGSILRVMRIT